MRVRRSLAAALFLSGLAFLWVSCRGVSDINVPPTPIAQIQPVTRRVFLIVFENQKYEGVLGNPHAPFINHLMTTRASADNFYANTHPSLGDYFMQTTGDIIYFPSYKSERYKVGIAYGNARWLNPFCVPLDVAHIGRIDTGLDEFVQRCERIIFDGPLNVTIERAE